MDIDLGIYVSAADWPWGGQVTLPWKVNAQNVCGTVR